MNTNTSDPRLLHFAALTQAEREAAVLRLADNGLADSTIAAACGMALEAVRSIIGKRREQLERARA